MNKTIEVLLLNRINLDSVAKMTNLCNGRKENKRIRELQLNYFDTRQSDAFIKFCEFLKGNKTIETLELQKGNLGLDHSIFIYFCDSLNRIINLRIQI